MASSPNISLRRSSRLKRELLTRMFPRDLAKSRGHVLSAFHNESNPGGVDRLEKSNVLGIGIGAKESEGRFTGDTALRVYVRRKVSLSEVSRRYRIPKAVDGMQTDVVKISTPRFQASSLQIGWPLGPVGGLEGSIGCVLKRPADNSFFVLSASHVMVQNDAAQFGDPIHSSQGFSAANNALATLTDFEPLKPAPFPNRFDAAIALLKKKADVALTIPEVGPLLPTTLEPVKFQSVRKFGSATFHTLGIVTAYDVDMTFSRGGDDYLFDDVIEVTGCGGVFSKSGDSGALVVDALTSQPIGTIIGGAGPRTLLSPINRILSRFQCEIAQ